MGRDFLPRGSGICTRRPLVLQLLCVDEARAHTRSHFCSFLSRSVHRVTQLNS